MWYSMAKVPEQVLCRKIVPLLESESNTKPLRFGCTSALMTRCINNSMLFYSHIFLYLITPNFRRVFFVNAALENSYWIGLWSIGGHAITPQEKIRSFCTLETQYKTLDVPYDVWSLPVVLPLSPPSLRSNPFQFRYTFLSISLFRIEFQSFLVAPFLCSSFLLSPHSTPLTVWLTPSPTFPFPDEFGCSKSFLSVCVTVSKCWCALSHPFPL